MDELASTSVKPHWTPVSAAPDSAHALRARDFGRIAPLLAVAFIAVCFAVHLYRIDADTPMNLGGVRLDGGAFFDEGYKTLDARNLALYGKPRWTSADEYSGWSSNPFTIWSNYWTFRLLGVSLRNARLLSLLFALGCAILMWLLLKDRFGPIHASWGIAVFVMHPLFILYSRQALVEIKMLFFGLCILYFLLSRRQSLPLRIVAAASAFYLGFLCKDTMTPWLGAALGAAAAICLSYVAKQARTRKLIVAGLIVIVVAAWVWYAFYEGQVLIRGRQLASPAQVVKSLMSLGILRMNPVVGLLALIGCGSLFHSFVNHLEFRRADLLMAFWFLLPAATFSLFEYNPTRYYMLCLPAIAWLTVFAILNLPAILRGMLSGPSASTGFAVLALIGVVGILHCGVRLLEILPFQSIGPGAALKLGVSRYGMPHLLWLSVASLLSITWLSRRSSFPVIATAAATGLLSGAFLLNVYEFAAWTRSPQYDLTRAFEAVRSLGPQAIVVGEWAPQFCIDTQARTIYSSRQHGGWNMTNLRAIQPSHLLFVESSSRDRGIRDQMDGLYPGARSAQPVLRFEYAGEQVAIYPFSVSRLASQSKADRPSEDRR